MTYTEKEAYLCGRSYNERIDAKYRIGQIVRVGMRFTGLDCYVPDEWTGCDFKVIGGSSPFYDLEELTTGLEVNMCAARLTLTSAAKYQRPIQVKTKVPA